MGLDIAAIPKTIMNGISQPINYLNARNIIRITAEKYARFIKNIRLCSTFSLFKKHPSLLIFYTDGQGYII